MKKQLIVGAIFAFTAAITSQAELDVTSVILTVPDAYMRPAGEISITNAVSVLINDEKGIVSALLATNVTNGTLLFNSDGTFDYTASGEGADAFWYNAVTATSTSAPVKVALFTHPPLSGSENIHLYLLIGQSNMAGRAPYTEEELGVIEGCYLLNDSDLWEPALNPLNKYSTIKNPKRKQNMNPGYSFAQTMVDSDSTISLGLVVNARGGTSITKWEKGNEEFGYYAEAIRRTQIAQTNATLKGILWHQGESDYKDAEYLEKLTNLVANLRLDLGEPNLPFIAGEITSVDGALINGQINQLPGLVPFTGVAAAGDLVLLGEWHFDAASQKLLGQRYAAEMQRIQAPRLSGVEYSEGHVTLGLTSLMPDAVINILQSPSLSSSSWSTSATFSVSSVVTNWIDSATAPAMFYKTEWK